MIRSDQYEDVEVLLVALPPWGVDTPPLGPACLSAALRHHAIGVQVYDVNIKLYNSVPEHERYLWGMNYSHLWREEESFARIWNSLRPYFDSLVSYVAHHPAPIVGFSLPTNCSDFVLAILCKAVKAQASEKKLIVGGVSVSIFEQRAALLEKVGDYIDYCVVGEGEESLVALVHELIHKKKDDPIDISGVVSAQEDVSNIPARICADLNICAWPTFEEFSFEEYNVPQSLVMEFSRGCVGNCSFCDFKSVSPRHRVKSPKMIVDQIVFYKKKYGINHVSVCDPAVNGTVSALKDICAKLIERAVDIRINALAIPRKEMTRALMDTMKRAGFYRLEYGVESGANAVLRAMRKICLIEDAEATIKNTFEAGIETYIYLIVGYPSETEEDFNKTKTFLQRMAPYISMVKSTNPLYVMAGSELSRKNEEYGIVLPQDNADVDWYLKAGGNDRAIRDERLYRLKAEIARLHIPFTEETENIELTHDYLKEQRGAAVNCRGAKETKVLLLNLPWLENEAHGVRAGSRWPHVKEQTENEYLPFPFFLAQGTRLLKENGYQARLVDAIAENIDEQEMRRRIDEYGPSVLVVETSTITLENDIAFIHALGDRYTVILVGPEPHIATEDFLLAQPAIDFTIQGEYEFSLLRLLDAREAGRGFADVSGLCYRDNGGVRVNEVSALCCLDDLPWPERSDVPLERYNDTPGGIPQPSVQLLASRGCPFGCIFCLWPQVMYGGRNYRVRNYLDVVNEMEHLVSQGYKSFYFDDDTFGLNREWVLNFSEEIIRRNAEGRINVPWAMMSRADHLDKEMLVRMKEAGLAAVKYGVETASPDLLKASGKGCDRVKLERVIGETKALGIKVHLTFTFGLPGETHRSANDTIFYAFHLSPDSVQFSVTTPFPGTAYYDIAKKEGMLVSEDWARYDGNHHSVVRTTHLMPHELVGYKNKAYRLWGLYDRARRTHRVVLRVMKIYLYFKVMGPTRMCVQVQNYIRRKFRVLNKIAYIAHRIINPIRVRFQDRLTYIGIFHGKKGFVGPRLIQIDLTNDCNNDCIGCWCNSPLLEEKRLSGEEKKKHLPWHVAKKVIDDAASMGTTEIYLAGGGEPFMYPHIMDVIRYIKQKGMVLYINTNFTLVDIGMLQEMVDLAVDHLTVSIWAGTPDVYHKTHPNKDPETFIELENKLKFLNSIKASGKPPYVKVYHVISNLNYHEIEYMYDFVTRTKSESVEFTVLDTIPGKTDVLMLNDGEMRALKKDAERLKERVADLTMNGLCPPILFRFEQFVRRISGGESVEGNYDKNIIESIPCYVGWIFSRIMPDGNVNGCLKGHRVPLGNVNANSFRTLWNAPSQQYFREKTYVVEKQDPFFSLIGNDPQAPVGCYKGCDDLGRNQHTHKAIQSLSTPERIFLQMLARGYRVAQKIRTRIRGIQQYEINSPWAKKARRDRLEKIPDLELRGIADQFKAYTGPAHVVIDITNRCNNSCLACWMYSPYLGEKRISPEWARKELPEKRVMALLEDLHDLGTAIVRFTGGGEPLLHTGFARCVQQAKRYGMRVAVTTSVPVLSEEAMQALLSVDELAISLWAGDAETYAVMHPNQKKEHFYYIEETLLRIREHRIPTQTLTMCNVLTNKNYKNVASMISFAQKIRVEKIYFALVDGIDNATDALLLNDEQRAWLYDFFTQYDMAKPGMIMVENYDGLLARLSDAEGVSTGNYDSKRIDAMPCYMGWHFSRILANGDVVPCCRAVKKIMGNIVRDRFKDIWHGAPQEEFRNNALRLSKYDSYFSEIECFKSCDNLMQNAMVHQKRMAHKI